MSYEVCVTRADYSWENEGREIPLDDWKRVVGDDPTLRPLPDTDDGAVLWSGHPDGEAVTLRLRSGNLVARPVDEAVIGKLVALAEALGGRAQGDDGEIYTSSSEWSLPEEGKGARGTPSALANLAARVKESFLMASDVLRGNRAPKPFPVGCRVRCRLLGEGEVVGYEYGPLNNILVKLDSGRLLRRAVLLDGEDTAGLELVDDTR